MSVVESILREMQALYVRGMVPTHIELTEGDAAMLGDELSGDGEVIRFRGHPVRIAATSRVVGEAR